MKKLFPILLALLLCLTGCGNKPLTEAEYEFPKLSWGMSIEQVQQQYPQMVYSDTDPYTVDQNEQQVYYTVETVCFGHPATVRFGFQTFLSKADNSKQNSYLCFASGTIYDWEDEALLATYDAPLIEQWKNPDYIETEVTEKQRAVAEANVRLIPGNILSSHAVPYILAKSQPDTIDGELVYTFFLNALNWVLFNIEMERPE